MKRDVLTGRAVFLAAATPPASLVPAAEQAASEILRHSDIDKR